MFIVGIQRVIDVTMHDDQKVHFYGNYNYVAPN